MLKYIVCPGCNRSVKLEDGGVDRKVYVCGICGAKIRYRAKSKVDAEAKARHKKQKNGAKAAPVSAKGHKTNASQDEADFRLRWRAEYRCEDGHYVRSKNEMIVDNWLYSHGICHAYEKAVFDAESGKTMCSDFFVPSMNLYIEIWGMTSENYAARRAEKVELYRKLGCKLFEIDGDDVKNVDDVLTREFSRY